MTAPAIGTRARLALIDEVLAGTLPATPAMRIIRTTDIRPGGTKTSVESQETTNARELADMIETDARGGWSANHEFSYSNLDLEFLPSLFGADWAANVLKVGGAIRSLSAEIGYPDAEIWRLYKYSVANDFTLEFRRGSPISGSIGAVSQFPEFSDAAKFADTYVAATSPTTYPVMSPVASVQLKEEGGVAISGQTEGTIHLANGLIDFSELGVLGPTGFDVGQFVGEGTFSVYVRNDHTRYLDKWGDWTNTSIKFGLGGAAAKRYNFLFNNCKILNVEDSGLRVNNAIIARISWKALADATHSVAEITRIP